MNKPLSPLLGPEGYQIGQLRRAALLGHPLKQQYDRVRLVPSLDEGARGKRKSNDILRKFLGYHITLLKI